MVLVLTQSRFFFLFPFESDSFVWTCLMSVCQAQQMEKDCLFSKVCLRHFAQTLFRKMLKNERVKTEQQHWKLVRKGTCLILAGKGSSTVSYIFFLPAACKMSFNSRNSEKRMVSVGHCTIPKPCRCLRHDD